MNDLVALHFDTSRVRMTMINGEPWWVAADAAPILEFHSAQTMVRSLDDDEKGYAEMHTPSASGDGRGGGIQRLLVISLSGLLACTIRSRSPHANQFRRWVTGEVLPTILRHGQYPAPPAIDPATLPAPHSQQIMADATPAARMLVELERIAAAERQTVEAHFGKVISKAKLVALRRGDGSVAGLLTGKDNVLPELVGAGVDLRFVFTGMFENTPDERDLRDALRGLGGQNRAVALQQLRGQISRLALVG